MHIKLAKNLCQISMRKTFSKSQICTQTLTSPENHVNIFENQKLNATIQTPIQYNTFQTTSFTKYLYFLRHRPNLKFLTWKIPKFKVYIFLPGVLSSTQTEPKKPKRPKIDSHLDHKTSVHILLVDAACRWFVLVTLFRSLFELPNGATSSNHLKSAHVMWKVTWKVCEKWIWAKNCV